jgi:hypothetical protein
MQRSARICPQILAAKQAQAGFARREKQRQHHRNDE